MYFVDLSQYERPFRARDNRKNWVTVVQPPASAILPIVEMIVRGDSPWEAEMPVSNSNRWADDNASWVVGIWLPGMYVPWRSRAPAPNIARALSAINHDTLVATVEAYGSLAIYPDGVIKSFEEACCNGSSVVADVMMPMDVWTKDPAAVFHDLRFCSHHSGDIPDCTGKIWSFEASNRGYGDFFTAVGQETTGKTRYEGLQLVSKPIWDKGW